MNTTTTTHHFTVTTYLGVRHYDNAGAVFTTRERAEKFARRCQGGSARSGSGCAATISPCACAKWAGQE